MNGRRNVNTKEKEKLLQEEVHNAIDDEILAEFQGLTAKNKKNIIAYLSTLLSGQATVLFGQGITVS